MLMIDVFRHQGFLLLALEPDVRTSVVRTLTLAQKFFLQPLTVKLRYADRDRREGYRPIGSEYSLSADRPDLAETFSCSVANRAILNSFPSGIGSELYGALLELSAHLAAIGELLTRTLCETISKVDHRTFDIVEWSRLQVNYTRPAMAERDILHDRHEDGDLFTLAMATAPGLEIELEHDHWQHLWEPERLTVLPGETLWLITGGLISPLYHRVRRKDVAARLAILYFADAAPAESAPWLVTDINRDIDIGSRLFTNSFRYGVPPVRDRGSTE